VFRSLGRVLAVAVAAGAAFLFVPSSGWAQDDDLPGREPGRLLEPTIPPRSQEFRFSYRFNLNYPGHIDRENIATFSMAASDTLHLALQDDADDPFYLRIPKWGAAFAMDSAIRYVAHEYGHLSSFSKAGYRTAIFGDKNKLSTSAPRASLSRMLLDGFNPWSSSAVSVSQSDWDGIVTDFGGDQDKLRRFRIMIKGGGLNQESVTLERYADRLIDGELSYLDTMPFVISGAAVLRYPVGMELSDTGDYIHELRAGGLRTTAGRIHTLSALTLLSGSTLAAARGFVFGLTSSRGGRVEPFVLSPVASVEVFAPELENYLSQYGPTLKPSLPLRIHGVVLRPSYEHLFITGKSMGEAGLSVRAPLTSFLVLAGAGFRNSDGGSWFEGGVDVFPLTWLALSVGYAEGWDYSFHRDVYGAGNDLLHRRERSLLLGVSAFHQF
jgi:hypothetical protein